MLEKSFISPATSRLEKAALNLPSNATCEIKSIIVMNRLGPAMTTSKVKILSFNMLTESLPKNVETHFESSTQNRYKMMEVLDEKNPYELV